MKKITKVDAIKKVLDENNGVATLDIIYQRIGNHYPNARSSKNWEAGIRGVLYRELSNNNIFKKVGLGLYALKDYKEEQIEDVKKDNYRMHSFMEGICLEIGNFLKLKTFTADPNAKYNSIALSNIASLSDIPFFTYNEILDRAKRIDVLWFNEKGFQFPKRAIEIVDSIGTLESALKRTFQLIEFNLDFYILCKNEHKNKIEKEIKSEPYIRVKNRYKVRDYDYILDLYKNPIRAQDDDFFKVQQHF